MHDYFGGAGMYTTTRWYIEQNVPTVTTWQPGTFQTKTRPLVIKVGSSYKEIPISVIGVNYRTNIGGTSSSFSVVDGALASGVTVCSDGDTLRTNATEFHLRQGSSETGGEPCVSSKYIVNSEERNPFYYLKPVFEIDSNKVKNAFNDLPPGVYRGSIIVPFRYYYKSQSNVVTYNTITRTLNFEIDYQVRGLSIISVVGDGNIIPTYNKTKKTVSGSTDFNITAQGELNNGLSIKIKNPTTEDFVLKSSQGFKPIKYSISCSGCSDSSLVNAGNVVKSDTKINTSGSPINFKISVSYSDISSNDVETGKYSDSFTLIFEEGL